MKQNQAALLMSHGGPKNISCEVDKRQSKYLECKVQFAFM